MITRLQYGKWWLNYGIIWNKWMFFVRVRDLSKPLKRSEFLFGKYVEYRTNSYLGMTGFGGGSGHKITLFWLQLNFMKVLYRT